MSRPPLVSVVIPCYNQRRFLGDAIASVLRQSYSDHEIVVVDDGSTDDSHTVASRYAAVHLIRQRNRGLSAARNTGLYRSSGDYLVFLDADDRLLPDALEAGVDCLASHPESAFVYGLYNLITTDGIPMQSSRRRRAAADDYLNMLRRNYIGMHATVMYRRTILDGLRGFNTSLAVCEDYDLYLRVIRNLPIHCHGRVVAEYRQHNESMSSNPDLMLKTSLFVLGSQRKYIKGIKQAEIAYKAGRKHWRDYYGKKLMRSMRSRVRARNWKQVIRGALILLRYHPTGVAQKVGKKLMGIAALAPKLFSIRNSI